MRVDRILTTSDAARMLERSTAMVGRYAISGRLPAVRAVNGTRFFREQDVARLCRGVAEGWQGRAVSDGGKLERMGPHPIVEIR